MCDVATGCKAADKGMLQKFIERLIHCYFKVCQWFSVSKDISVSVNQFLFHKKWNKKKEEYDLTFLEWAGLILIWLKIPTWILVFVVFTSENM